MRMVYCFRRSLLKTNIKALNGIVTLTIPLLGSRLLHNVQHVGRLGNHFATAYRFLALGYCCKSKLVRRTFLPRPITA